MAAEKGKAGIRVRLQSLLIRKDWIYVLSLLIPVLFYNVTLKVVRVATQFEIPGPLGFLDQIRSDLLFNLGYAVLWIGVFAVLRGGIPRLIALGFFHVFSILVVVLTTCAHVFFLKTGSTLGLIFVLNSLSSFGEIWGAITSETKLMHWIVIPVAPRTASPKRETWPPVIWPSSWAMTPCTSFAFSALVMSPECR
jgi:lipoteichoic acid synthase